MPLETGVVLTIRVATWNVERPKRNRGVRERRVDSQINAIRADIWVLTESRVSYAPVPDFHGVHSTPDDDRRPDTDERWVSIWARWPTEIVAADQWFATARVQSPMGDVLVFGVVLPYMHEPGVGGARLPGWTRFCEELACQRRQWVEIRGVYPTLPTIIAGDFNQSLGLNHWYGSKRTRSALLEAFRAAGFRCLTADVVVDSRKIGRRPLVDHICCSDRLEVAGGCECWGPESTEGKVLSDHPGVAVDLTLTSDG